jgi:hypothetical protein
VELSTQEIQLLREKYPWPENKPAYEPVEWALDGGGRELIKKNIDTTRPFLIVEIGSFLGSSIKKWLATSSNVYVAAIDPWEGDWWVEYPKKHGRHELIELFSKENGPYFTFLSSLWDQRERIFPIRGTSPEKLYELANLGIEPDMIYLDSDKTGVEIEIAHELFPNALITGDDWTWGIAQGYPIRKAAKKFVETYQEFHIISHRATWVITKEPITLPEYFYLIESSLRDILRWLRWKLFYR